MSIVSACATATHSIGDAARMIVYGDADVMVAGGARMGSTPSVLAVLQQRVPYLPETMIQKRQAARGIKIVTVLY